ncbi:MAG: 30S ribosomal protein S13 [Candidatus Tagabacteria bacterium CG09_land_8_20_14_0_10_41_14]|uniref:Small ribosomal subunit protein uS13 n=2 Tax=Candidatus Tagaibacteriota TaxID=1817918 RepID=A0A2H0WL02_9BACT|nr:MAG: 30S ribosomal protein S13 [Candidatus Tagabacteria bacterium CG09_land_8_20_14_0_10_41_14]PJE72941.1 MAG: 30S ribosomal protein S13 [Candidatus Tagabacteria bacterium CG10_big_fil_rev_8_21_14_0_10_40_13]
MRITGITLPENKRLEVALTYLYGIGRSRAIQILKEISISPDKKTKDLSQDESNKLRILLEKYKIENDLRREITGNIKRLKEIKSYRGTRHMRNLPSRGQRTKTNSRTTRPYKGRKTMTSGKRKAEKK